jgi:hypothetical protein
MAAHEEMTHDQANELLPWLVNDSLDAEQRDAVRAHASSCVICRREVAELEILQRSIRDLPAQEAVPEPDMRRINARIDAHLGRDSRPGRAFSYLRSWLGSPLRIAFVAQSILLLAIAAVWLQPNEADPVFRTLTSTEPLPSGHYLRVVFDPTIEEGGLAALLESSGLSVVSGPSERGVFTLQFADGAGSAERDEIIRQMRDDSRVLFAEAVESGE